MSVYIGHFNIKFCHKRAEYHNSFKKILKSQILVILMADNFTHNKLKTSCILYVLTCFEEDIFSSVGTISNIQTQLRIQLSGRSRVFLSLVSVSAKHLMNNLNYRQAMFV